VFGTTDKSGKGAANEDPDNKITGKLMEARLRRKQKNKIDMGVPGPKYYIPGDFDFPDARHPEPSKDKNWAPIGQYPEIAVNQKKPKFCFGMNTKVRAKNLDMPGPGEYEVDMYPMNQKNIAYWIGTDDRKDLAPPRSYQYPGPGSYNAMDTYAKAPTVSFTKDAKDTRIEKTNDPGPATYGVVGTVGVIPSYQRNEANAREVAINSKKKDDEDFFQ